MITWIIVVVMILYLTDLVLSFHYMKGYREHFPKGDWAAVEANPIIRFFIRISGLKEGIVQGGILVFAVLAAILILTPVKFHYFLAGMYYMMNVFHFLNFMALKRLRETKTQNLLKGGKPNGKKTKSKTRRNN